MSWLYGSSTGKCRKCNGRRWIIFPFIRCPVCEGKGGILYIHAEGGLIEEPFDLEKEIREKARRLRDLLVWLSF